MSASASGTFARALTYLRCSNCHVVKKYSRPTGDPTTKQLAIRSLTRFLTQLWPDLTTAQKATWNEIAAARRISPANAFFAANHARWQRLQGLTATRLPTATTYPGYFDHLFANAIDNNIELSYVLEYASPPYLIAFLRSDSPIIIPEPTQLAIITVAPWDSEVYYYDTPPSAGTWYYRAYAMDLTGMISALSPEASATI